MRQDRFIIINGHAVGKSYPFCAYDGRYLRMICPRWLSKILFSLMAVFSALINICFAIKLPSQQ